MIRFQNHFTAVLLALFVTALPARSYARPGEKDAILPVTLQRAPDKHVYFERVFTVDGASQEVLYSRAKKWVSGKLRAVDNNIVFDDKEHGYINTTASLALNDNGKATSVNFKVELSFKDGKVRMLCPAFTYLSIAPGNIYEDEFGTVSWARLDMSKKRLYTTFDERYGALIQSLEQSLSSTDNW